MDWSSLFTQGPTTCKQCANRHISARQLIDITVVNQRFAELGLILAEPYRGSHYHHSITCLRCNDTKILKPNTVWGYGGMSCRCTKSTPLFCIDIIADAIGTHDPALQTEFRYPNTSKDRKLDIWCPSFRCGFEVKYGAHAFGRNEPSRNAAFRRYKHVIDQARDYVRSGLSVAYIVIAPQGKYWCPAYIRNNFPVYDLPTLKDIRRGKLPLLMDSDIKTLAALFYQPSTIRGLTPLDTVERQRIRKSLADYLAAKCNVFPTQRQIKTHFGFTIKKLKASLGLDGAAGRDAVIRACESLLGITPSFVRGKYRSTFLRSNPRPLSTQQQVTRRQLLRWLKTHRRPPSRSEDSRLFRVSRRGLQVLLGIRPQGNKELRNHELCKQINLLPEMHGYTVWDLPPTADVLGTKDKEVVAGLRAGLDATGLCPACKQHADATSGLLCAKCCRNAERYLPNEANPLSRALMYVRSGLVDRIAEVGSDEWRRRLSESRRSELPATLQKLLEEIEEAGCVVCGKPCIAATGLCSAHQQAVKKHWLDAQGNTPEARVHYLTEIRHRFRTISSAKSLSADKLSEILDPLFCAHDFRWLTHAREYLEYVLTYRRHPTQTSIETGLRHAVWRAHALKYTKGAAVDLIRKNVLRLLTTCRPAEDS
jgi:hypothetical protein